MSSKADLTVLERDPATVLVVDAYEPSRLGLGLLLQRESWVARCLVAGSLEQAVQVAARQRPHVAVLDISELGPFAAAAVTRLREARPGLQVVLSSHCASVTQPEPRAAGATAFVPAGNAVDVFKQALQAALWEEPVPAALQPSLAEVDGPVQDHPLSPRERDVLQLLITGATNREIAAQLYLGPDTVKKHASSVYRKLGVRNRTEATQQASRLALH